MKTPGEHPREAERLASLHACGLRDDVVVDPELTRIARRAAEHFGAPVALVSVVLRDRQVFAGRFGLDAEETSRDVSFCAHVVVNEAPLVVPDARNDDRFADNPLVTGFPEIRFYAGDPVYTPRGLPMGTVCLIDREPRRFGDTELAALGAFAAEVEESLRERASPTPSGP